MAKKAKKANKPITKKAAAAKPSKGYSSKRPKVVKKVAKKAADGYGPSKLYGRGEDDGPVKRPVTGGGNKKSSKKK